MPPEQITLTASHPQSCPPDGPDDDDSNADDDDVTQPSPEPELPVERYLVVEFDAQPDAPALSYELSSYDWPWCSDD